MIRIFTLCLSLFLLTGCAATSSTSRHLKSDVPQDILGRQWQWVSTTTPQETITVDAPKNYTLLLKTDRRAHARFDCNRGGGSFEITPGTLSFGPMISTKAACRPGSLDHRFARDLQRVVSFFTQDNHLYLLLPAHSGTMKFQPVKND